MSFIFFTLAFIGLIVLSVVGCIFLWKVVRKKVDELFKTNLRCQKLLSGDRLKDDNLVDLASIGALGAIFFLFGSALFLLTMLIEVMFS